MKNKNGFFTRIRRRPVTIGLLISGLALPLTIGYAIYDFVLTAKKKDDQAQSATLKVEAAQFAFAMRDEEGTPLADNPLVLGPLARENQVVSIKKPFFTYLLNRANAKSFDASNLSWRPPRSCSIDFPVWDDKIYSAGSPASLVRTCFATVKDDPTGRYLYFSVRYPTEAVIRHQAGEPLRASNSVRIEFSGTKTTKITLVYGIPTLAKERYPSQKARFDKIHEISGYFSDDTKGLIRSLNGQAYERQMEIGGRPAENYVTLIGRLDSNILLGPNEDFDDLRKMRIGVEIYDVESPGAKRGTVIKIPNSNKGESVISLEKLYRTQIQSKASLEIYDLNVSKSKPIWQSKSLSTGIENSRPSGFQRLSDWLADSMVTIFNFRREADAARQEILGPGLFVTLKEEKASLPDIATRSLFFLTLALVIIILLEAYGLYVVFSIRSVVKRAYRFTLAPLSRENLPIYNGKTEITILGRTLNLLIRKIRSRDDGIQRREKRERDKAQLREQHMKSRQRLLDAIGHEIRSPLQTLMNKKNSADDRRVLSRMDRAVKALAEATSVEAGIKSNLVIISKGDIAAYLYQFCKNTATSIGISYYGKQSDVFARYDDVNLEQVIEHVIENAKYHRTPGTDIEIRLLESEDVVSLEIFNQGNNIDEDRLDAIFELGESTGGEGNFGQGLFVAQTYIVFGMKGSILARNENNGVSIVIGLPRYS